MENLNNNRMDFKEFNNIVKIIKAMKCKIFTIGPNDIIGSDEFMTTLTVVRINTSANKYYEFTKELFDTMIKDISLSNSADKLDYNKVMDKLYSIKRISFIPVIELYNRVMISITIPSIYIDNIRLDDNFNNSIAMKADDGSILYKIDDRHLISIFSGLLPINKYVSQIVKKHLAN